MHDIETQSLASAYCQALTSNDDIASKTKADTTLRHAAITLVAASPVSAEQLPQQQYTGSTLVSESIKRSCKLYVLSPFPHGFNNFSFRDEPNVIRSRIVADEPRLATLNASRISCARNLREHTRDRWVSDSLGLLKGIARLCRDTAVHDCDVSHVQRYVTRVLWKCIVPFADRKHPPRVVVLSALHGLCYHLECFVLCDGTSSACMLL